MTRRDLLLFLFRWKKTILGWWLFTAVLVAALAYVKPPVFQAHSSVLVERTKAPVIFAPTTNAPEMKEAMTTEAGIVQSRPVFAAVVDKLHLDAPANTEAPGPFSRLLVSLGLKQQVSPREGWIRTLATELKAEPVVDSNLLTISFKDHDPVLAAQVVNAVTDAYLAHRQNVYSSRGGSDYLEQKRDEAEAELMQLRRELSQLKSREGLSAIDDAKAQWARDIGVLTERLAALQVQKGDLETRYAADHPKVKVLTRAIANAEAELAARRHSLRSAEAEEAGINDLEARIEAQQKIFFDLKTQYEEAVAREQAPRDLVNAQVVEYAAVPATPRFSRLRLIELGLIAGFLLALLLAFVRQYFDQRIHDPDTAEQILGLPVLGSIPKQSSAGPLRFLGRRSQPG